MICRECPAGRRIMRNEHQCVKCIPYGMILKEDHKCEREGWRAYERDERDGEIVQGEDEIQEELKGSYANVVVIA